MGLETGVEGASVDTGLSRRDAVGAYAGVSIGIGAQPFRSDLEVTL